MDGRSVENLLGRSRSLPEAASPGKLGERLVEAGLIRPERLEAALERQRSEGGRLGQVLIAEGWIRPLDFYQALASHLGLPFVNLVEAPPEEALFEEARIEDYAGRLYLPWRRDGASMAVAVAEPDEPLLEDLRAAFGAETQFVITSRLDILWSIQKLGWRRLAQDAVFERARKSPEFSAAEVLSRGQKAGLALLAALLAAGLAWKPWAVLLALHWALAGFLLAGFLLRFLLVWGGSARLFRARVSPQELAAADPRSLPVYSVLVPLYRDAAVVPVLARALRSIDYPRSKLDIKLILEADDPETIEACKKAGLEGNVELILVPPAPPRTKPKALNYALRFCRGQLVTIYDAGEEHDLGYIAMELLEGKDLTHPGAGPAQEGRAGLLEGPVGGRLPAGAAELLQLGRELAGTDVHA